MRKQAGFGVAERHNAYCGYCFRDNYIAGSSHNLYSDNQVLTHKIAAVHKDPDGLVVWAIVAMLPAFVALLILT